MTITVTHAFTSNIADDPKAAAAGEVLPSHWNAAHVVSGSTGREILVANRSYFISTTGSDSNDGLTLGTAWATLQHAMDVISGTLDIGGFTITVNIGAGSFAGLAIKGCVGAGTIKFIGAGISSTTITDGPNDGVYNFGECVDVIQYNTNLIQFDLLTFQNHGVNNNEVIVFYHYGFIILGNSANINPPATCGCDLTFIPAGGIVVDMQDAGECVDFGMAYTGGGASIAYGILIEGTVNSIYSCNSMTISGTLTITGAFLKIVGEGSYLVNGSAYVAAGTTGQRFDISTGGFCVGGSGASFSPGVMGPNFLPGNTAGTVGDPSSIYDGYFFFQSIASTPTTANLATPGSVGIFKDTIGGTLRLAANDAGTIKSVVLTT